MAASFVLWISVSCYLFLQAIAQSASGGGGELKVMCIMCHS